MRVSYLNRLKTATLSATNEDINQPIENIIHNFLELPFYSDTDNSVITIIFDEVYDINHIAFDFHNIDNMTVRMYDSLNVLIDTQIIDVETGCNFHTWNTVENVLAVTITIDTLATLLYVGGMSMGTYFEFPRFRQTIESETGIFDDSFISGGGQRSGNRKKNLDTHPVNFANLTREEKDNVKVYLAFVQTSMPHFVDFYEDDHENFSPFYGAIVNKTISHPKRRISEWRYDLSLVYQEAR